MRLALAVAASLAAAPLAAEPPTLEQILAGLDGTAVQATGTLTSQRPMMFFRLDGGPSFPLETAVPRGVLERAERCQRDAPRCPAQIVGVVRVTSGEIELLADEILFLD